MDNLKQKINAEIGGPKWNDALSEAIQQKAKKKSISAYGIVTFCAIALACFLLVLNLQPANMTPAVKTGDLTAIQLKELYVADGDWSQDSFYAKPSSLYLETSEIQATDLHEFNAIFANMQPTTSGYPSYFDGWYQKDLLAIDANDQHWRLKLFIFGGNDALLFDIDSGVLYEYKNDQFGEENPLNQIIFIFDSLRLQSSTFLYILALLSINLVIQLFFKVKYHIPIYQKVFDESNKNLIFSAIEFAILIGMLLLVHYKVITFIPLILLLIFVLLCVHLSVIYRVQTKLYFIRELLISVTAFIVCTLILLMI